MPEGMTTCAVQGTRSILCGIHNLQLQSNGPALVTRPQGQLQPPLLTSAIQPYHGALPDLPQQHQSQPKPPSDPKATTPQNKTARSSQARHSARKSTSAFGGASSLLSGRGLLTQPLNRVGTPGAFASKTGAFGGTPEAATTQSPNADMWSTPVADQVVGQEEGFCTPGTLTQDEWNAMMQTGSAESPASSSKASGRKKGFRPAVKKQRLGGSLPG